MCPPDLQNNACCCLVGHVLCARDQDSQSMARAEFHDCLADNINCQDNVSTHCGTDSPACLLKQLIVLC